MGKMNMTSVSRTFNKVGFKLKQHSPEILVIAGVVGTVTSAVLACRATLKVDKVTEKTKASVEKIHTAVENGVTEAGEVYTVEDSKKDLTLVYTKTGVDLLKLYGPALAIGAVSITAILAGHNITRKRSLALAAAYTALDKSFKGYRGRVVERFGKELDRELRYNIKATEIEETNVNEDGSATTVKKTVSVGTPSDFSPYAKCFDETCAGWSRNAEDNLFFLKQQQNYLNQLLKTRGHVFLNEVYDALGFDRTKAGQQVGWVDDPNNPDCDGFIDFDIFDLYDPNKRAFVNGYEKSIWLDFNVDGVISELLP